MKPAPGVQNVIEAERLRALGDHAAEHLRALGD